MWLCDLSPESLNMEQMTLERRRILKRSCPPDLTNTSEDLKRLVEQLKDNMLELTTQLHTERKLAYDLAKDLELLRKPGPETVQKTYVSAEQGIELELCKAELESTKLELQQVIAERESIRSRLWRLEQPSPDSMAEPASNSPECSFAQDWTGCRYLSVQLLEDYCFRPGERVTPVGVMHKLFEMRLFGHKASNSFIHMLTMLNVRLAAALPDWYDCHFGFLGKENQQVVIAAHVNIEDFAWLLFEYDVYMIAIEVLMSLMTFPLKSGTTNQICNTNLRLQGYSTLLFLNRVNQFSEKFKPHLERALKVRESHKHMHMPYDIPYKESEMASKSSIAFTVIDSLKGHPVLAGSVDSPKVVAGRMDDPLLIDASLDLFTTSRGIPSKAGKNKQLGPLFGGQQPVRRSDQFLEGQQPVGGTNQVQKDSNKKRVPFEKFTYLG